MELVDGMDLEKYIGTYGRIIEINHIKKIGGQLISAIKYLHDNNIVHKDIKPPNIVFKEDLRELKLIDLGIS